MFEQQAVAENAFLRDVQSLRENSQARLSQPGLIVSGLTGPQTALSIELLQSVLAAEIICVMRYSMLAISEDALKSEFLATEFQAQANDERRHMAMLAARIEVLGGTPDYSPAGTNVRIAAFGRNSGSVATRMQMNLAAEQCVVEHYRELITFFDHHDPQTAAVLKDILQDEEDHTSDMQDLLGAYTG